jgi:N-formylglutamate deformylase
MLKTFDIEEGATPLLISMPHVGTAVPDDIARRLTPEALTLPDTDWHVDRLYDFAHELGAWMIRPHCSRYVVDLNRPSDGALLYPGMHETPVCPSTTFNGAALYLDGSAPSPQEIEVRVATYWRPYHAMLATTLEALKVRFGYALLWDAHSIRSEVPALFEGTLPVFNLGIGQGTPLTCPLPVAERLLNICAETPEHSAVLNGRFKGGYITRHYGAPENGIWAVQLELSQRAYMDESQPQSGLTTAAEATQRVIRELLTAYLEAGRANLRK